MVRPREVAVLPAGIDCEDAAAVPLAGLTSLQALRDIARVKSGYRVLINGASGGVGTLAIQIAALLGAEVTSLTSRRNRNLCRELGAHRQLAYEDDELGDERFDTIFDVYGNLHGRDAGRNLVAGGVFVSTIPTAARVVRNLLPGLGAYKQRLVIVKPNREDLDQLARWLADGRVRPIIDLRLDLAEVARSFELLESRRTRGKIVVKVSR